MHARDEVRSSSALRSHERKLRSSLCFTLDLLLTSRSSHVSFVSDSQTRRLSVPLLPAEVGD